MDLKNFRLNRDVVPGRNQSGLSSRDERLGQEVSLLLVYQWLCELFKSREDVILENAELGYLHIVLKAECKPESFQFFFFFLLFFGQQRGILCLYK